MKVLFDGGLLEHVGTERSAKVIATLLRGLVECNLAYLEKHPRTPHPYKAGLRYIREHKSERWKSIPKVLADGGGDCEDLAAYAAASSSFTKGSPSNWSSAGSAPAAAASTTSWCADRAVTSIRASGSACEPREGGDVSCRPC
jgi:hypothetical protein